MSERGVFAVDRGIWDHPGFADEPFTEREAWQWLIGDAAFKDRVKRVGSIVVKLQRGQTANSTRFLQERWKWKSETRVRRFLNRRKIAAEIVADTDAGVTVITICNYNKYQRVSLPSVADTDAPSVAAASQQRRKIEDTENKETDSEAKASESRAPVDDRWPADFREQFWARYPNKVGKPKALAKLEGIRKRAVLVPFEGIMIGLENYIRSKPPDRQWLNPETFLNQERWADQPASIAPQGQNGRRTVHDAAKDLLAKVRAFDAEPPRGICDGTGEPPLRLLSSGRCE